MKVLQPEANNLCRREFSLFCGRRRGAEKIDKKLVFQRREDWRVIVMAGVQTDLTQGSVTSQLIRYSVPIITSSLLQALYGMTDMLIVSQFLGSTGASAVNNAGQITRIVTNIVIGFANGGSVLVGQYFGSGDREKRERAIGTFLSFFTLLGIFCSVLLALTSRQLLALLRAPAMEEAYAYLFVCSLASSLSLPTTRWLRCSARSEIPENRSSVS
jgi:Na+-driven multidrug efflux pump